MSTVKEAAKTKADIIQETLEYYSQDPCRRRAFDGGCHYLHIDPDGTKRRCAVGRCLSEEAKSNEIIGDYGQGAKSLALSHGNGDIDNLLAPEYRGHDIHFWLLLQGLHDHSRNWTDDGLSVNGELDVKRMCDMCAVDFDKIDFSSVNHSGVNPNG